MKYLKYLILIVLTITFTTSCKKQKEHDTRRSEYLRPAAMDFTAQDSSQIISLVNSYITCITTGDAKTAASMLYTHKKDSVFPLEAKERENLEKFYNTMPMYKARISSFSLMDRTDNIVGLTVQITRHGDLDKEIGVTHLKLRPVKFKDQWYLTLLDNEALRVTELNK